MNASWINQILQDKQSWDKARANGSLDKFGIAGGDDVETYQMKLLRFGNQFPAMCYAYGIGFDVVTDSFPEIFSAKYHYDSVKGSDWPTYENILSKKYDRINQEILDEILDKKRWDWYRIDEVDRWYAEGHLNQYFQNFTIDDQIDFILRNRQRQPKKILEIGGGRGEVANTFKKLNADCHSIDPGQYADVLYDYTGKLFFGETFASASPIPVSLQEFTDKWEFNQFDTVIFCESIEHVSESEFWNFWHKIKKTFNGLVIIVNWMYFHPIPKGGTEHIFEINDEIYDRLIAESKHCVYRNHSHLVLQLECQR